MYQNQTCWGYQPFGYDSYSVPDNLFQSFSSGPFNLPKGRTERISMGMIVAFENLSTLNNQREAPIIFERKKMVQTIYEADYRFARPPLMPTLTATAGDGQVVLTWDAIADIATRETLLGGVNDFEGYRLYKATDISFFDAQVITDGFGAPSGNLPIFQCDLDDEHTGFTDFAYVEGTGFFLGYNTGIQHHYIDRDVENGRTYYYYLTAYDYGIRSTNIAPSENVATIVVDEEEHITFMTPNVQVVTPRPPVNDYVSPEIEFLTDPGGLDGSGSISVNVEEPHRVKQGHTYKLTFGIDTLTARINIPEEVNYRNDRFQIYDVTDSTRLVYEETPEHYIGDNVLEQFARYYLNDVGGVETDIFEGLKITMSDLVTEASWDSQATGWMEGNGEINIEANNNVIIRFPWRYDLVFTGESDAYMTKFTGNDITSLDNETISDWLRDQSFPFYVENKMYYDEDLGEYRKAEIVPVDYNGNGTFELEEDDMYIGYYRVRGSRHIWLGSLYRIDFRGISEENMAEGGDVYRIENFRPFTISDSLVFQIASPEEQNNMQAEDLARVRVVPNPYIITNSMEPAVRNNTLNQRRRLMFTNVPSECTIKIFTMSGYLVDRIDVNNDADNGIVHWDLLTKENLEIAAGVYLYHIKSLKTGEEKLSKFAVIK
jgi:hypothetical protein